MAEEKRIPVRDKYGNITGYRGSGAQGAAEDSKINNAGAGGLGAIAAKNKGTTGSGVSVPTSGGLTEAQKRLAEEEAAEEAKRRKKKPVNPNKPNEPF